MPKIVYTKHAKKKFFDLAALGIIVKKGLVEKIIREPQAVDMESDVPKIIASGELNEEYILRVVYKKERGIIVVITFYPARKERYT